MVRVQTDTSNCLVRRHGARWSEENLIEQYLGVYGGNTSPNATYYQTDVHELDRGAIDCSHERLWDDGTIYRSRVNSFVLTFPSELSAKSKCLAVGSD